MLKFCHDPGWFRCDVVFLSGALVPDRWRESVSMHLQLITSNQHGGLQDLRSPPDHQLNHSNHKTIYGPSCLTSSVISLCVISCSHFSSCPHLRFILHLPPCLPGHPLSLVLRSCFLPACIFLPATTAPPAVIGKLTCLPSCSPQSSTSPGNCIWTFPFCPPLTSPCFPRESPLPQ